MRARLADFCGNSNRKMKNKIKTIANTRRKKMRHEFRIGYTVSGHETHRRTPSAFDSNNNAKQ